MLFHVGAAQVNISIHTPLAGSDHAGTARKGWALYFNPHSPCGERLAFCFNRPHSSIFQSTLPLRGATSRLLRPIRVPKYFNPHSPCGERRHRTRSTTHLLISIHTPLAGSDAMPELFVRDRLRISIHTPLAGSDTGAVESIEIQGISIHTPLAGSDVQSNPSTNFPFYFNPHSPCGERRFHRAMRGETEIFPSTLPLRGATITLCRRRNAHLFQSTLPLRGATSQPLR